MHYILMGEETSSQNSGVDKNAEVVKWKSQVDFFMAALIAQVAQLMQPQLGQFGQQ